MPQAHSPQSWDETLKVLVNRRDTDEASLKDWKARRDALPEYDPYNYRDEANERIGFLERALKDTDAKLTTEKRPGNNLNMIRYGTGSVIAYA